jgi:biotin transport system ATP-binding protein
MFRIDNVSHSFGEVTVLDDLSLIIAERRVAVIGSNGSGKSTFVRLLNGLLIPDSGTVTVDGIDTRADARAVRRKVGFVFQNPDNQIVFPIVEEDLAFGLSNLKLPSAEIDRRIGEILARYGLTHLRQRPSYTLSGGEKQMLAISGVLAMEPACVVFDEPTTLLDLRNKRRVLEAIDTMPQMAVVVTHDIDQLERFERVLVFDAGRVVADDVPGRAVARYREIVE